MEVPPVLDIVCLCAAWCGTCKDYAATFEQLRAAWPGHRCRWIDIEDEADRVGDIDVETFPTLLIACDGVVWFAGPVLPRLTDAQRLVEVTRAQVVGGAPVPDAGVLGLPPDQFEAFTALARGLLAEA